VGIWDIMNSIHRKKSGIGPRSKLCWTSSLMYVNCSTDHTKHTNKKLNVVRQIVMPLGLSCKHNTTCYATKYQASQTKRRVYFAHGELFVADPLQATWLTLKVSCHIVCKNVFCKHTSMQAAHMHLATLICTFQILEVKIYDHVLHQSMSAGKFHVRPDV
jgi:hypothetical protein